MHIWRAVYNAPIFFKLSAILQDSHQALSALEKTPRSLTERANHSR